MICKINNIMIKIKYAKDYIIYNDEIIIFRPLYNDDLANYETVISNYKKIIFSNFENMLTSIEDNNLMILEDYSNEEFNKIINCVYSKPHLFKPNFSSIKNYKKSQYNYPINFNYYEHVTHLTLGHDYNCSFYYTPESSLNLTHLTFGHSFNQTLILPKNVTHLTFGNKFNQKINLPNNLTHLTFGYEFNQKVNLPEKLTYLIFGFNFNQKVNLPNNIIKLKINNNKIDIDYLSNNLEELELGKCFNLQIDNLPNSIKILKIFNDNYNKNLNCLPNSIEILQLPKNYKIENIPSNLQKIL